MKVPATETPSVGIREFRAALAEYIDADTPVTVSLRGRNLTDAEIREHASYLKDIAPSPGRSVSLGLAFTF